MHLPLPATLTRVRAAGLQALSLLFPPDPGALRLLAALRATLAAVLTFFLAMLLGTCIALTIADRILGFALALFIAANVRDAVPRQRLLTIVLASAAAFASTAFAAVLVRQHLLAALAVPLLMFVAARGSARGPRYATLGIVSLIAYFIGLVSGEPPDALPHRLLVVALAGAVAALTVFVLLPVRPEAELARLRRAIHADIVRLLGRIAAAIDAGAWTAPERAALRRDIRRLSEAIMLAQARLATLAAEAPGLGNRWLHLLAIELAVERVARIALRDLGTPVERAALLAAIAALQREAPAPQPRSAAELAGALALLGHAMQEVPSAAPTPAVAPPAATGAGLRSALQTAIAAAIAIAAGELVSPSRWYWAAFAAFVMFQGTRSRGESIAKGLRFIIGTGVGVVAGMLAATLLHGDELLSLAAIVLAVFLAFQANQAAYGVMVFWITIILGLLFGMLGYFPPDLLLLRLQEAAVGAASGALVAALVLVRQDRDATRDASIAFMVALRAAVDSAARTLVADTPAPDLAARVLAAQQRFLELSDIARAEQAGIVGTRDEALRRRMLLLGACEHWARGLGALGLQAVKVRDPVLARSVRDVAAEIDATLADLIGRRDRPPAGQPEADASAHAVGQRLEDEPADQAVRLLLRIAAALANLASQPVSPGAGTPAPAAR